MPRLELDHEDLMAQATALQRRGQFRIAAQQTVIAGYHSDGAVSVYFGPDPCYHFDANLRLRRAYIDGMLYRTQSHTLARLCRVRGTGQRSCSVTI